MQEYIKVELQLHLLCQILAKVTANFIAEKEDYSHTNLAFDGISNRISTRWMENTKGRVFLALDIDQLSYQWIDESLQVIEEISISGQTLAELESKIASSLIAVGFKNRELLVPLKYKFELYPYGKVAFQQIGKTLKDSWSSYRSLANNACEALLNHINEKVEIRIWPHHFDTGIYQEIGGKLGIGFGLAVKDIFSDSPYFYLKGYGLQHEIVLEGLPEFSYGSWKTEDLNGAILPISELEHLNYSEKTKVVNAFNKTALAWYINHTLK